MKIKKKYLKFVDKYEKEVQEYRKDYYKNIIKNSSNYKTKRTPTVLLFLLPLVAAFIVLFLTQFSIIGYIAAAILIIVVNILLKILTKLLKLDTENKYLAAIKKQGFFSIEDYEKKLKKYVLGPGGVYEYILSQLKAQYNINETTRKIYATNGEEYYIWPNQNADSINLLNCKNLTRPTIETIKIAHIRYFRIENERRCIVLKTDMEDYELTPNSLDVLNELLKQKKLENIHSFTPEDYITDFEIYMHNYKEKQAKINQYKSAKYRSTISQFILVVLLEIGVIVGAFFLDKYAMIFEIGSLILFIAINSLFIQLLAPSNKTPKTDYQNIVELNKNDELVARFEELKKSLSIRNTYDKVFTTEGACYLTWVANGYFHVFLNLIYYNVVYMVIKTEDVRFYQVVKNTCELKLKDKTLVFQKDAAKVFGKILPNKDYEWLKGYQNSK